MDITNYKNIMRRKSIGPLDLAITEFYCIYICIYGFRNLFCSLHVPVNMDRGLYWFTFVTVTSLTYDVTVSLQCPTSADAWERASLALQCKSPNSYHCLKDEKNVITEQCLAKVWIEGGMDKSH